MEADDEGWVTVTKSTKKKVRKRRGRDLMEAELKARSLLIKSIDQWETGNL